MAAHDPIDQIMTSLRDRGSIDPASAAARTARMRQEANLLGGPPVQGGRPPSASPSAGPTPTQEEGSEGLVEMAPGRDFTLMSVDGLNEVILANKAAIHREADPERVRLLERQNEQIRRMIQDLGGDPIWADESIEEGLTKLQGRGQIVAPQLQQTIQGHIGFFGSPEAYAQEIQRKAAAGQTLDDPGAAAAFRQMRPDLFGGGGPTVPQAQPVDQLDATLRQIGVGRTTSTSSPLSSTGAPPTPEQLEHRRWIEQTFDTGLSGYIARQQARYREALATGDTDLVQRLLADASRVGFDLPITEDRVVGPPELQVDSSYVNQILGQLGLEPRSAEEIEEHARALVERQAFEMSRIVERELERFEREFPAEFERAQQQIGEAAAGQRADIQEEMAARGMFYTSIMAGRLEEVDEKEMDLIGEIARDAANIVAELRADLRDIAQWAVLEQEVVRRELEAEDRALRERLANIHLEVAMWADQQAIDVWYREAQLELGRRAQQLDELRFQREEAERLGMHQALGMMVDHPLVRDTLRQMGFSPQQIASMPLEQRSALIESVVAFNEADIRIKKQQADIAAITASIQLSRAQAAAARAGADAPRVDLNVTERQALESALGLLDSANQGLSALSTLTSDEQTGTRQQVIMEINRTLLEIEQVHLPMLAGAPAETVQYIRSAINRIRTELSQPRPNVSKVQEETTSLVDRLGALLQTRGPAAPGVAHLDKATTDGILGRWLETRGPAAPGVAQLGR